LQSARRGRIVVPQQQPMAAKIFAIWLFLDATIFTQLALDVGALCPESPAAQATPMVSFCTSISGN
jgi:hypothetical protein